MARYVDNIVKLMGFVMFVMLVITFIFLAVRPGKVNLFDHDHPEPATIIASDY